jgi:hypothetical protein
MQEELAAVHATPGGGRVLLPRLAVGINDVAFVILRGKLDGICP